MNTIQSLLAGNAYPGRGILVGSLGGRAVTARALGTRIPYSWSPAVARSSSMPRRSGLTKVGEEGPRLTSRPISCSRGTAAPGAGVWPTTVEAGAEA